MSRTNGTVNISIDNKPYEASDGMTILEVARQNDIYIPTLCAHEDLSPHGGCRMCIVEVEGIRNFPTACTTPVSDGMVIRTHTAQVEAVREEVLQLFLSEHTSSCLICDEKDECKQVLSTIRKAGVTTGCRYCPKDGQCELQAVTERMEVKELKYPIHYRNFRVEKEDPFYDRDYNLCILCGRCVRMCQEVRTANVIAITKRGRESIVAPAFGRTHMEAGCEFCGACVSVCPTGSLREKAREWEGFPDREVTTTCSFCGVGCQMQLQVKKDAVIGSLPAHDNLVNNGQLCVKGRFCISELVNDYQRLKQPYHMTGGTRAEISWDDAVSRAADKLSGCSPDEFGMLVSPTCWNEDLYVGQKFARVVMGSHNVDTSTRSFYGPGFNAYLDLMRRSVPMSELQKASTILCVGLDTRFARSVVVVEIRKAIKGGARLFTINPRHHSLTFLAEKWLQPEPGDELALLKKLTRLAGKKSAGQSSKDDAAELACILRESKNPMILVGSEFLQHDQSADILKTVMELVDVIGAGLMPLPAQNNLLGTVLMGTYPELLPGGQESSSKKRLGELNRAWSTKLQAATAGWDSSRLTGKKKLKVLYLVGEALPPGASADHVILQNIYPPAELSHADLVLPSAAFTESDGSFINGEGRVQRVRKAVEPHGRSLPDWEILCRIAKKMGKKGFDFTSADQVHKEISSLVKEIPGFSDKKRKPGALASIGALKVPKGKASAIRKPDKQYPYILTASVCEHTYRGFALSAWVDGATKILYDGTIQMNPNDAKRSKISEGDIVLVKSSHFERKWPVRILRDQPPKTLQVTLHHGETLHPNPLPVKIRKSHV